MSYSSRDLARFAQHIDGELKRNPLWTVVASDTRWFCPYCAAEAVKRWPKETSEQVQVILQHLVKGCPTWAEFKGKYRSASELARRKKQRELRTRIKRCLVTKKEWQFTDVENDWYCPFCCKETKVQVPKNRQMTEEALSGMIDHVQECYEYKRRKGKEQERAFIQTIVTKENKRKKLRAKVKRLLAEEDPVWSQRADGGAWICPYCHLSQDRIDITSPLARRENAPGQIADHLTASCLEHDKGGPPTMAGGAPMPSEEVPTLTSDDKIVVPAGARKGPNEDVSGSGLLSLEGPTSQQARRKQRTWGKDGELAADEHGLTLEDFEKSGDAMLISDEELPETLRTQRFDQERLDAMELPAPAPRKRVTSADVDPQMSAIQSEAIFPDVPGFELATHVEGSSGADFIDVVRMGPLFVFALGSVRQKNEDPRRVCALARNLLRIHIRDTTDPGEIIKLINGDLFPKLEPKTFVSMVVAMLDPRPGRMVFSRAGLSAPILVRPSRRQFVRIQDFEGMPIGADAGPMFDPTVSSTRLQLEQGDLFVLHTDGVLEVRNRLREPWGAQRLEHVVRRYGNYEAEYFTDKLKEKIELFARSDELSSDIAVLALKRAQPVAADAFWS